MYQQLVKNEYGEPMYVENVMDAQEENEAYLEEMQMRADDPMYAAMREKEEWIARATSVFEDYGLKVPYNVKEAWVKEMRQLQMKNEEEKVMSKVRPFLDFLNRMMPNAEWFANYYGETPDEVAHVEVDYKHAPYKEDYLHALNVWREKYKDNDDMLYVPGDSLVCSTRYMKGKENITNK
jgi:hypothetical protein